MRCGALKNAAPGVEKKMALVRTLAKSELSVERSEQQGGKGGS